MKYLCLIYCDAGNLEDLTTHEREALLREQREFGQELLRRGRGILAWEFRAGGFVTTVNVQNGRLTVTEGCCSRAANQLVGFHVIDARDLNDAVRIASRMPAARLGPVDIRPLQDSDPLEHDRRCQFRHCGGSRERAWRME